MSRDNPTPRPAETDKPAPAAPAPADGSKESRPLAEPRSQAQHAADVHSRPPIRRFEPASPTGSTPPTGGHAPGTRTPADSDRTGTGTSDRPHGQAPSGRHLGTGDHRVGTPDSVRGMPSRPPETSGSQARPASRAPGSGTGSTSDHGGRPAPETVQSRDQGGRAPGSELPGSGRQLAEPRSQAQFAKDVMSRPPIRRFEPATPTASPDTSGSPASRAPETGSATRQRPARETTQQASTPTRERQASETNTETSATGQPDAEPPGRDRPSAPQRPPAEAAHNAAAADANPSPAADTHVAPGTIAPLAETGNNRAVDRDQHTPETTGNVGPRPSDSGTRPAHTTSGTSENPNPPAAERPVAPPTSASTQETGGGREPAAAKSSEAHPVQASTTEHEPQTQDPEPDPEAASSPGDNGAAGQQADASHPILHITSEHHDQKYEMFTDGTNWISGEAVRAMAAKDGQSKTPERHAITGFPQQRDLGDNIVGEKETRSPGDTTDLPPTGEELVENAFEDSPRLDRLRNKTIREIGDIVNSSKEEVDAVREYLQHPQPTGYREVPVRHGPVAAPQGVQHATPDADSVTQMVFVLGVLGIEGGRWAGRKIHEFTRRHDAGHG